MKMLKMLQSMFMGIGQKLRQLDWVKDASHIVEIMYQTYLAPVVNFFAPTVKRIARVYGWAFRKLAYVEGIMSHKRAALIAVPILTASTWFIIFIGIPETYDFAVDGAGVLTERTEHVFLTGAGPVPGSPEEDVFQAKGCTQLPCTEDTATYYHIRPNSVKTLIKIVTQGTVYLPEEVEAAIPDQLSECDVTIQWIRVRALKMYNTITEVSCMPVSEGK